MPPDETRARLPLVLRVVHWVIIVNLLVQICYGAYMVFVVVRPEGVTGPLWSAANSISPDVLLVRRAYAIETWIAIVGLSIYLGVTEILPRRLGRR